MKEEEKERVFCASDWCLKPSRSRGESSARIVIKESSHRLSKEVYDYKEYSFARVQNVVMHSQIMRHAKEWELWKVTMGKR